MRLPNASLARVDKRKILDYLLRSEHPDGASKARFFARFGFTASGWRLLADALAAHGQRNEVVKVVETPYGTRYIVDGELEVPDGRHPMVRTVWVLDRGAESVRLITAHPLGDQS